MPVMLYHQQNTKVLLFLVYTLKQGMIYIDVSLCQFNGYNLFLQYETGKKLTLKSPYSEEIY